MVLIPLMENCLKENDNLIMKHLDDLARIFWNLALYSPIFTFPLVFILTKGTNLYRIIIALSISVLLSFVFFIIYTNLMAQAMSMNDF
jgi:hypothetical protein